MIWEQAPAKAGTICVFWNNDLDLSYKETTKYESSPFFTILKYVVEILSVPVLMKGFP